MPSNNSIYSQEMRDKTVKYIFECYDDSQYELFNGVKIDKDLIFYAEADSNQIEKDYQLLCYGHVVSENI